MSGTKNTEPLEDILSDILLNYGVDLPTSLWASEKDRWLELLICVINQVVPAPNITEVREIVDIWEKLHFTSPASLSAIQTSSKEYAVMIITLQQYGFDDQEATVAANSAIGLAKAVQHHYHGKIQTIIRKHAEALQKDLVDAFAAIDLDSTQINYAVIHWLQNTANAPLTLSHQAVKNFYKEKGIDEAALVAAADQLDINLSVIDDVLEKRENLQSA